MMGEGQEEGGELKIRLGVRHQDHQDSKILRRFLGVFKQTLRLV